MTWAFWSGSTLFGKTCLSKNLGSLQYIHCCYSMEIQDADLSTIKLLKIQTPEKIAVITLKFEQGGLP